jgi:hypothetical protein
VLPDGDGLTGFLVRAFGITATVEPDKAATGVVALFGLTELVDPTQRIRGGYSLAFVERLVQSIIGGLGVAEVGVALGVPTQQPQVASARGLVLESVDHVGEGPVIVGLDAKLVRVIRVAGTVTVKQFPKSKAGRRTVPLSDFAAEALKRHRDTYPPGPLCEVFTNTAGGPVRRTLFRSRVWRPALVRAGLLGEVVKPGHLTYRASWIDTAGTEWSVDLPTEREAVAHVAKMAVGGLQFHDLRHSYATHMGRWASRSTTSRRSWATSGRRQR